MLGLLILFPYFLTSVYGHGYLFEPVARSSAWLVDSSFRQCCTWPNHMEMFCGGLGHQWNVNDGKCSICGEPYDKKVKLFEKGGAMYKGTIVKTYTQGEQIDVKVMLTANHKGYFEFRLCNLDASPLADANQECLDRHQLIIAGTNSTKFRDVNKYGSEMITVHVQLPLDVACQHCVFQWKYTAGNSWGTDPTTGQSGAGLGRENETFMGCSDIAILSDGSPTDPPIVIVPTTSTIRTTSTTTKISTTTSTVITSTHHWTRPSTTSQWSTSSTASSTITWTWPSLSTHESLSSTTTTTTRRPLGLTTWSSDFFEYQIGDEVMYDGMKYRCVAPHRSYPGAEPGILTWAWWKPIQEEEEKSTEK
ncbi:unnamed protein product [Rotaria sp. Silwood2]|nr:unnamed protein product [Rotaria sp. Silwood2]CAF3070705.1 unnamed protein product [Rotaria sp. Silwood2]CAF4095519.1 unnamed protein product [Rotaria sp. Silwood2]CAF4202277.1 unnamed protein product [Rotaria sp. Silwood2]CAF4580217.1 unnamed protein product [Rotaria sp. Silwood2]